MATSQSTSRQQQQQRTKQQQQPQFPGPRMQRLNATIHREPLSSIVYNIFWIITLAFGTPIAILVLFGRLFMILYSILLRRKKKEDFNDYKFDPKNHQETLLEMAVVVTGCDSGFGQDIAIEAAKAGFVVFAGCLQNESVEKTFAHVSPNLIPVQMDVTSDEDVAAVVARVGEWLNETTAGTDSSEKETKKKKRVLHGVINNAGIGITGFVDWLDIKDFRRVMEVNFFGVLRCCKAFLPILKEQSISGKHVDSRILNLTSVAGIQPCTPNGSAYGASKQAAQALSQSLRAELAPFRIIVSTINPAVHQTPLVMTIGESFSKQWNQVPREIKDQYGEDLFVELCDFIENLMISSAWNVSVVTDQLLHCLKSQRVPPEVVVGMDGRFLSVFTRMLPAWVLEYVMDTLGPKVVPAAILKQSK